MIPILFPGVFDLFNLGGDQAPPLRSGGSLIDHEPDSWRHQRAAAERREYRAGRCACARPFLWFLLGALLALAAVAISGCAPGSWPPTTKENP